MTLVLTALSEDTIWQVADRRLTKAGQLYDDAAIKSIVVRCSDATFVMGYTGMALAQGDRGERLDAWIAKAVSEWAVQSLTCLNILERLAIELTGLVRRMRIPSEYRRLTIAIAGFGPPGPFFARITNAENVEGGELAEVMDEFKLYMAFRNEKPMLRLDMSLVGATSAVGNALRSAIQKARKKWFQRHPKRVLDGLVHILREASGDPLSGHLIGKSCLGAIIHRAGQVVCFDYPEGKTSRTSTPHFVSASISAINVMLDRPAKNAFEIKGQFKFSGNSSSSVGIDQKTKDDEV